ncbi:MAG TPA: 5'/3'-nucleotidase SurE [Rugosimonospora sp.]|nr:5'/3'-nucleotidase SurE [Rugosimonospora sp.]
MGGARLRHNPAPAALPRALVTNDDGWSAPGIRALAIAVRAAGWSLVVAAPHRESSGISAALTAVTDQGRIVVDRVALAGLDGVPAFRVAASPAYIAVLAGLGSFGPPPDVVLSGINRGANAGHAVMHSGTVGATLVAANNGVRAMAVSLDVLSPAAGSSASGGAAIAALDTVDDEARHWTTAAGYARRLLPALLEVPAGTVLNLNVPDLPEHEVRGLRQATLAPFGQTQLALAETGADFVRVAIEENGARQEPGTDLAFLAQGYASVSPIRPVSDATDVVLSLA